MTWFVSKGKKNVAEILIKKGADVNMKNKNGVSPIYEAVGYQHCHGKLVFQMWSGDRINSCSIFKFYGFFCSF